MLKVQVITYNRYPDTFPKVSCVEIEESILTPQIAAKLFNERYGEDDFTCDDFKMNNKNTIAKLESDEEDYLCIVVE